MPINEPDDGKSYGMSAVANWVEEDEFPTTKDDILSRFSEKTVMMGNDEEANFGEIMEHVEQKEYEDIVDFWSALGEGFRSIDERIQDRYTQDES